MEVFKENDLVLIVYKDRKYLKEASPGKSFHGKGGILEYSSLLGKPSGIHFGGYDVYLPTMEDIIMYGLRRETQIIYAKDGVYICFKLSLRCGSRVLEIGTGSGALTYLMSHAVGPEGRVVSFEKELRHYRNAKKNIVRFAPWENCDLHHGDIADYEGDEFDAVFIDVREPWLYLRKAYGLLKSGGPLGIIVPTSNQISEVLREIHVQFGDVEVLEIMLRKYKTIAERVRPEDRMVAHTGYLIFARKLTGSVGAGNEEDEASPVLLQ